MSVYKSVSKSVFRSVYPSTKVPMALLGSGESIIDSTSWFARWDASNEDSISHALGFVSTIDDLSGNNRHLTGFAGTGGALPLTGTRTANGLNVLDFQYSRLARGNADLALSQPFVVFLIVGKDSPPSHSASLIFITGGTATINVNTNGGLSISGVGTGSVSLTDYATANIVVMSYDAAGTRSFLQINSTRNTPAATLGSIVNYIYVCGTSGSSWLDGFFGEMAIYSGAMDDTAIAAYVAAFAAKWGVTL